MQKLSKVQQGVMEFIRENHTDISPVSINNKTIVCGFKCMEVRESATIFSLIRNGHIEVENMHFVDVHGGSFGCYSAMRCFVKSFK